jgi:hypothetical protein
MIALAANKSIMRSKFPNNAFLSFDLMIDLLATRTIMRSKCVIMLVWVSISLSKCRPPDRHCQILMNKFDLMKKLNFDLMKKWISISWKLTSWSIPTLTNWNHWLYLDFCSSEGINKGLIDQLFFSICSITKQTWPVLYMASQKFILVWHKKLFKIYKE